MDRLSLEFVVASLRLLLMHVLGAAAFVVAAIDGSAQEIKISPVLLMCIEEASLPALQEGSVEKVHVKEGSAVAVGTPVVQLDDRMARFRKEKAEVEYQIARKKAEDKSAIQLASVEIKVASANLQRAMESRKKFRDTPSQAEVDELELRLAQAQQHYEKSTNDLELAKLSEELARTTFEGAQFDWARFSANSPIEGIVVEVLAKPGDWVRPGQPLARVIRTTRLRAEGNLRRDLVTQNLLGRSVEFVSESDPKGKTKHMGKIVFVNVEVDPNDRGQRIIAEIDNSSALLSPGLRGELLVR